jgi:ubiquinone/menaquinone biosynthesis C-methylase UbiE
MNTPKPNYTQYYEKFFDKIVNRGFNGYLYAFTHKKLELIPRLPNGKKRTVSLNILEVGGGSGQHAEFVKNSFEMYTITDINKLLLPKNTRKSRSLKINYLVADIQDLQFDDETFDRVIVTCLLHHLENVEKALSEILRVTKKTGLLSIYVSCDPGLLNRLARMFLVIPKAKKIGFLEYRLMIAREHRNHFTSIETMIKHVFRGQNIQQKFYPFAIRSWNFNAFCVFQIQVTS